MVCQSAAAVIIIIHTGQIIMDQAVCMDHLNCRGKGCCSLPITAAQPAKFKGKNGPQAFSSGKQAVFHRLK